MTVYIQKYIRDVLRRNADAINKKTGDVNIA